MSTSIGSKIITDGLVLVLDTCNHNSYPGTSNWRDIIGDTESSSFNSITVVGDKYFSFNGSTSKINFTDVMPDDIFLNGGTCLTWVYPDTDGEGDNGCTISKIRSDFTQGGWQMGVRLESSGQVKPYFLSGYGSGIFNMWQSTNYEMNTNEWSSITWTLDDSDVLNVGDLYINGVNVASELGLTGGTPADPKPSDATAPLIAGDRQFSDRSWDGMISYIAFYDRILTATEIRQNHNALNERFNA